MAEDEPGAATLPAWLGIAIVASSLLCVCYCARGMLGKSELLRRFGKRVTAARDGVDIKLLAAVDPRRLPRRFRSMTGHAGLAAQRNASVLGSGRAPRTTTRWCGVGARAALPGVPLPMRSVVCADTSAVVVAVPVDAHG